MKISLICTKGGWHANELIKAAKKNKIQLEKILLQDINENFDSRFGDVIIWFSSKLETLDRKNLCFHLMRTRVVLNNDCLELPFLTRKYFQQKYLESYSSLNSIPTFVFKNQKELLSAIPQKLKYPIIQKPNYGSQGDDITLLKSEKDLKKHSYDTQKYIYQNFIENNGDYRVFVLGGRMLGVIKRVARKGSYLNNISKGGSAEVVSNEKLLTEFEKIALSVASMFKLSLCGIDIIQDLKNGKLYFMEVNTNPEWKGFQQATGINVAEKIIDYCLDLHNRKLKNKTDLIRQYFDKNIANLGNQKFHYVSRMYLWTREKFYREELDKLKNQYLGKNQNEVQEKIKDLLKLKYNYNQNNLIAWKTRKEYMLKYPWLAPFNAVLFRHLFAGTLYGNNLRDSIKKEISDKEFVKLGNKLYKDKKAIIIMSTFAVNYFYNLDHYFGKSRYANPQYFLKIFEEYAWKLPGNETLGLYMLTHAIIGASKFYAFPIKRVKIYKKMLNRIEDLIIEKYFDLHLDIKFEFLVCCRICAHKSKLEKIILGEAEKSLADNGNFLISRFSGLPTSISRNFPDAEHRNVLFIMANNDFAPLKRHLSQH